MTNIGRMLLVGGGILAFVGLVIMLIGKTAFIGKLPGDIFIQKGNSTLYLPLATFLILSVVLTVVVNILMRLFK